MHIFKSYLIIILCFTSISMFSQKSIRMVTAKGGTFQMGSKEKNFPDESPIRTLTVKSFYISQYEIFHDDYWAFCKAAGYAEPTGKFGLTATNISWQHAVMMCNWLSGRDGFQHAYTINRDDKTGLFEATCDFTKNGYRLPTEAEWEYAARGAHRDKPSVYAGSNSPYNVAWFFENAQSSEKKSGELRPNEIGVYDMSGNIEEWCWDVYAETYDAKAEKTNPTGPKTGTERVIRGGSRRNKPEFVTVTRRQHKTPKERDAYLGFRVVRTKTD